VEIVYYAGQTPHGALELCKHPQRSVFCGGSNLSSGTGTAGSKGWPLSNGAWLESVSVKAPSCLLDTEQQGVLSCFIIPSACSRLIMNKFLAG